MDAPGTAPVVIAAVNHLTSRISNTTRVGSAAIVGVNDLTPRVDLAVI